MLNSARSSSVMAAASLRAVGDNALLSTCVARGPRLPGSGGASIEIVSSATNAPASLIAAFQSVNTGAQQARIAPTSRSAYRSATRAKVRSGWLYSSLSPFANVTTRDWPINTAVDPAVPSTIFPILCCCCGLRRVRFPCLNMGASTLKSQGPPALWNQSTTRAEIFFFDRDPRGRHPPYGFSDIYKAVPTKLEKI